ncbi:hypothetical protein [Nocardia sp. BMG111209]|uniref:hypothetical protein n=1 Tax=Nocardia sp. BMG111209 TaxID=1160137 RepID=UPI0005647691|nr:hypothetical protein [Nocardia sp. BMG111209]
MGTPAPPLSCYLVEWYRPGLDAETFDGMTVALATCAASMSAEGSPVELLLTLCVPEDEFALGVLTAGSADIVTRVCLRAGTPAQRVTPADAYLSSRRPWGNP